MTLIEELAVIVIIGILATISFVVYSNMTDKAYYAQAIAEMDAMGKQVLITYADKGEFPGDKFPGESPDGVAEWIETGPYGAQYDYEHWVVSVRGNKCHYIMISWVGKDSRRRVPVHLAVQAELGTARVDDDLYEILHIGPCGKDLKVGAVN